MKHTILQKKPYLLLTAALLIFLQGFIIATFNEQESIAEEYFQLGKSCEQEKQMNKALGYYQKCLLNNPSHKNAHLRCGTLLRNSNQFNDAIRHFEIAFSFDNHDIFSGMELANSYNMVDRSIEALKLYMHILTIKEDYQPALHNFAFTLKKIGRYENAITVFEKLIALNPTYELAKFNLSAAYLSIGDYEKGFKLYESRWGAYGEQPKLFSYPVWDGTQELSGKTIRVYHEQGYGDTFQFVRYLELLKKKGATIIFEVPFALIPILSHCPYIDKLITAQEQTSFCDYQIPLMSLPYRCGTTVETVPQNIPYLFADKELVKTWGTRLKQDTNFKIGVCWHGNGRYPTLTLQKAVENKSIPLATLVNTLSAIPNVSLYSLQKVDGVEEIQTLPNPLAINTFDSNFDGNNRRFEDTAAVIQHMDLIVTIDTSLVHLAGGLGTTPVILLLPERGTADWRWLDGKDNSPWYPGMKILQQTTPHDWDSVMPLLAEQVKNSIAHHNSRKQTALPIHKSNVDNSHEKNNKRLVALEKIAIKAVAAAISK